MAIWVFISIAVVVLTVVIAFLSLGGNSGLPGNKTGTVDVIYPTTGRPSFSGTIDGTALTGKVTSGSVTQTPGRTLQGTSITLPVETTQSFVYKGHYGGNAFVLHLTLTTSGAGVDQDQQWRVTGTDGSSPVNGEATFDEPTSFDPSPTVSFSGSLGSQPIIGTASLTHRRGSIQVAVSFVNLP